MAIRTLSQIITDAINFLAERKPNIATFVGTVTRDVVIESPAQEFEKINQELERTQKLQSLTFASDMTTEELNALAANFGLTRLLGTQATGTVTFQIRNFTISSSEITIPVGTLITTIDTEDSPQIAFATTTPLVFTPALAPTFFNPVTGLFEQTTTIIAEAVGASGNVAAGTITSLSSSVPGIDSVVNNIATTGGTDVETNTDFASRITIKLSGNNVGTRTGIISLVKEDENVKDAIVVTPDDPELLRGEFGGEVDVYIDGSTLSTISDLQVYLVAGPQSFTLQRQPVNSVSSITGLVLGVPTTFVQTTDYTVDLDTTPLLGGSSRAESAITFTGSGQLPDDSTQITITYTYNSLIEDLQAVLDADDKNIVTSDILVREANVALIDIDADITIFPGFIAAEVTLAAQSAVSTFINNLGLGTDINRSDIIAEIEGVDGVDSVNTETLLLTKNAVPLSLTEQRLTIFKTETPDSGVITITIV